MTSLAIELLELPKIQRVSITTELFSHSKQFSRLDPPQFDRLILTTTG